MFINDMPQNSEFKTVLLVDSAYLMLADKTLHSLELNVNHKLVNVDQWLCLNKLTLNYFKTNFMPINKTEFIFGILSYTSVVF